MLFGGGGGVGPWLALGVLLTVLLPALVQAADTTSAIRGKIVGSNGAVVANATVVIRNERTAVERTYSSNDSGNFYAARLPVGGPYKITVNGTRTVTVERIALGDTYNITIDMQAGAIEEVIVYGESSGLSDVAAGPSANFSSYDLETSVAFDRDIIEVYTIDPRISLDQDGFQVNCAGKHPRFNSVTLDGVSQNDRFGLNSNGYSTATGMPFPFDAIKQVSVELAPFDVTYGGFSACNINSVTKTGSNDWEAGVFHEYTSDRFRGETIDGLADVTTPGYSEKKTGFHVGGPIIQDTLFFFGAYEKADEPRFIGQGYNGSGVGIERPWLSEADFNRIVNIAQTTYDYDPGGAPSDGVQENEKYMFRLDWNINEDHSAAIIYNYFDGFQDRASDGDSNEFEFSNHFYVKGSESETLTLKLSSQWTDALSSEVFWSSNEMNDLQQTRGPKDFGDFQISVNGRNNVYLGADDSRQANKLSTQSDYFRVVTNYLLGNHIITAGYEQEALEISNIFVQHSRGGEYDFFDNSVGASDFCNGLDAQGRLDTIGAGDEDAECGLSGIDKFELGQPDRIYYGSGGVTNVATDAAANFTNTLHSFFIQDEWYIPNYDLTMTFGLRYDRFSSDDSPKYNVVVSDLLNVRNDHNIDGVGILMPRIGFNWEARDGLVVRGGLGLYSGGNPTVWLSNAWSNDGITNVQRSLRSPDGSILDGTIPLQGTAGPGRATPQALFDFVANATPENGSTRRVVLLDPDYEQPSEWKFALGATYMLPYEIQMDLDWLHGKGQHSAIYRDLSQEVVGRTILDQPSYGYVNGSDNLMLTNASENIKSDTYSASFRKYFDFGLDVMLGYAYTEATDVNQMPSSTAGSNFANVATLDINDLGVGNSNWVTPHRFTLKASYAHDFFVGLTTRITIYGFASEGQPQSFIMRQQTCNSRNPCPDRRLLEGGGTRRHLLYVPTGATDPNVIFESGFDQNAFFAWANREDLGAGFVDRNETNAKWSYRLDFRFDQEIPSFVSDAVKGKVFVKIFNLTNLLNDDWGQAYDTEFFPRQVVTNTGGNDADTGQYIYSRFSDVNLNDLDDNRSLWEARFGIEFSF